VGDGGVPRIFWLQTVGCNSTVCCPPRAGGGSADRAHTRRRARLTRATRLGPNRRGHSVTMSVFGAEYDALYQRSKCLRLSVSATVRRGVTEALRRRGESLRNIPQL
jgi:hypothetical protein